MKRLSGIVVLVGAVGCGGVTLGYTSGGEGTRAGRTGGEDAGIDTADDAATDGGQAATEAGDDAALDAVVPARPGCNSSTFNTWQRYPGSTNSSFPGASAGGSLALGGNLVTTAGVIDDEFVIWHHGDACATEIYLPAQSSFPWLLVGATGSSCNLTSPGIWYPTGKGALPSYAQIPPYDTIHTPTSFSVDSSGNVYATGGGATTCASGSGIPHGLCIQRYDGKSWTALPNSPGAQQVTSGSADNVLIALDQDHGIWSVDYAGSSSWSKVTVTSICGGGSLNADLIAANSGFVYAINDAGGGAGSVYSFTIGASTCWSAVDDSVQMMSISANPQLNGVNALLGTDGSNGLWYFCNGNTP